MCVCVCVCAAIHIDPALLSVQFQVVLGGFLSAMKGQARTGLIEDKEIDLIATGVPQIIIQSHLTEQHHQEVIQQLKQVHQGQEKLRGIFDERLEGVIQGMKTGFHDTAGEVAKHVLKHFEVEGAQPLTEEGIQRLVQASIQDGLKSVSAQLGELQSLVREGPRLPASQCQCGSTEQQSSPGSDDPAEAINADIWWKSWNHSGKMGVAVPPDYSVSIQYVPRPHLLTHHAVSP